MNADELDLPQWRSDPYPLYAALRAKGPVLPSEQLQAWVVPRYAEVAAVLRDSRMSNRRGGIKFAEVAAPKQALAEAFKKDVKLWILFRDPPEHTRLRSLISKAFTPSLIESLRPRIAEIVNILLDRVKEQCRFDIVADLANPLPAIVIAELMGARTEDWDDFKRWADDLAAFLAPGSKSPEYTARALKSWSQMHDYLRELLAERRRSPQQDLASALVNVEAPGRKLSAEELSATMSLLLFAGHETTTNLIANGLLALLRNPESAELLRAQPGAVPTAVEEMLRYDSPVQMMRRMVQEDLVIAGQPLRRGEMLLLLLGSANRDAAQFSDPESFQPLRRENRHIAFGQGIHFCLGAALARVEGQEVVRAVLARMPMLRLASESIRWRDNLAFRCPESLPTEW